MTLSTETAFNTLVEDVARAVFSQESGPPDIFDQNAIVGRLSVAVPSFPPLYREATGEPVLQTFATIGPAGWQDLLDRDRGLQGVGLLGLDLVQTQIQRAEGYQGRATRALQEVVSDLYDGFLSAADRDGVKPPDHGVAAPLVKWGRPDFGPYAFTASATKLYGSGVGLVNMPPAFAEQGLAAWAALGHETAGHEILHADDGLHEELGEAVYEGIMASSDTGLKDENSRKHLAEYWSNRIDETASDVMAILNMGPAAAIGLIAYFRGLSIAGGGPGRLSPIGQAAGVHPAPLARGWVMVQALRHCSFREEADATKAAQKQSAPPDWIDELLVEIDRDVPRSKNLNLAGAVFTADVVRASAESVATAILTHKAEALDRHALLEIQDWRKHDQQIVELLTIHTILGGSMPPQSAFGGIFAAHAVAAAILASLISGDPQSAQTRMIELTANMHDANPSWSALRLGSRGEFGGVRHATGGTAFGLFRGAGAAGGPAVPVLAARGPAVPVLAAGGPPIPTLAPGGPAVIVLAGGQSSTGDEPPIILSSDGNWVQHQDTSAIRSAIGPSLLARAAEWTLKEHGIKVVNGQVRSAARDANISTKMARLLIGRCLD